MNLGRQAGLVVVNPSGNRTRVALRPLPFLIGRQPGNHLVVRDNRISRTHCRIVAERGELVIEDTASTHGVFVNGERVTRHPLRDNDKIELGVPDSYQLIFTVEEGELGRLLDRFETGRPAGGGNLANLRAVVEIARVLQSSLSVDEVLAAVVDAALTITSTERGFLLLRDGQDLKIRVARDASGQELPVADLRVPMQLIQRSLQHRRDLLTMNFDPDPGQGSNPDHSVANLELRSVVCVPLVRIRSNHQDQTQDLSRLTEGLIYLDSRLGAADLAAGNRELLQTLALEASTILENARLLEEERQKLHLEEELSVAREIQASLLPRDLPQDGWFRAAARSMPSHQVGGDYVDVKHTSDGWWAVVADVCGKGVSSALLASLLQGAFLLASESALPMEDTMARINRFLNERTGGEKYATIFCCALDHTGLLRWTNAGHCPPLLVRRQGKIEALESTGFPVGMIDSAEFVVRESRLQPGDKLVVFTDGLCEAQNDAGEYFEVRRIRNLLRENALTPSGETVKRLMSALQDFTAGAPQADDVTCLVLEYAS